MAKRYYIIPMAYPATHIEQHVKKLSSYGVSILDVFASVWRAIHDDDERHWLDVSNYVNRAINQQWYELRLIGSGSPEAMDQERDAVTMDIMDMCGDIKDHVARFVDIIIDVELNTSGYEYSLWGIHGMNGNDVVVFCEDPTEGLSVSSDLDFVQLR